MNSNTYFLQHYRSCPIASLEVDYYLIALPDAAMRTVYSVLAVEHWEGVAVETAFFYDVSENVRMLDRFLQKVAREGVEVGQLRYVIEDALHQYPSSIL